MPRQHPASHAWEAIAALIDDRALTEGLRGCGRVQQYNKGEVIYRAGDTGDVLHIVSHGRVALSVDRDEGERFIVRIVVAGDVLGGGMPNDERSAHMFRATALERSTTVAIRCDVLRDLERQHHAAVLALTTKSCRAWSGAAARLAEGFTMRADVRVRKTLVELGGIYASTSGGARIALTQGQIAAYAGVNRSTVSSTLGEASRSGLAELYRGAVVVPDLVLLAVWASDSTSEVTNTRVPDTASQDTAVQDGA